MEQNELMNLPSNSFVHQLCHCCEYWREYSRVDICPNASLIVRKLFMVDILLQHGEELDNVRVLRGDIETR